MPRKRTTKPKAGKVSKPPKNEPTELTLKEENLKAEQLEVFLKDFDLKVKTYLKNIGRMKRAWNTTILQRFQTLITNLGPDLQNMTIKEFILAGGTFESAKASFKENKCQNSVNIDTKAKVDRLKNLLCAGAIPRALDRVAEEDNEETLDKTDVKVETANPPRKKKTTTSSMAPPSTSIRKSKRTVSATPLNRFGKTEWGQTPLITPKFDPNLPATPDNIRKMKPGERLMSIAGSPVEASIHVESTVGPTLADYDLTPTRLEKMMKLFYDSQQKK